MSLPTRRHPASLVRRCPHLNVQSTEEACMGILGHQQCKLVYGFHFWFGFVAMPLQVASLPKHPPDTTSPDVGRLRDGRFAFLVRKLAPGRAYFENFYALSGYAVAKIQFGTNVWRWPTLLH